MSTNDRPVRARITTRVAADVAELIERLAQQRRTTVAHEARLLLEDAVREVAAQA
jgi:hypothetical protein